MYSKKRKFGNYGEQIVVNKLIKRGFVILDRNYLQKWGEIDIVARGTDNVVHFVEVKTVSRENMFTTPVRNDVSDDYRPEENVTREKLHKIIRTAHTWADAHQFTGKWQIDVATIEIDVIHNTGRMRLIENITL